MAQIELGLTDQYDIQFVDSAPKVIHQVGLGNLQTNTTYHYRVGAEDQRGNGPTFSADFTFTTPSTTTTAIVAVAQTHAYGNEGNNIVKISSNEREIPA